MLTLTFTCCVLLIYLLSNSVKMTDENQQLVLEQQWRQACASARVCARGRHRAVCGSNGRLYKSLCLFQRAQCINRQLKTAKMSTCTADALKSKCQLARSQALHASARSDPFDIFIPECKADGTYKECESEQPCCVVLRHAVTPQFHSKNLNVLSSNSSMVGIISSQVLEFHQCHYTICRGPGMRVTVPPFWLLILLNAAPPGNGSDRRSADSLMTCQNERISLLKAAVQASEERFIPECTADGSYRVVQCHSGTGYCWCVRPDSGRPIPGTADRTPGVSSSLQTLHQYFSGLDADADGFLSERESRPLRLLIRRALHPRRCAKKLLQSCERTTERGFSPQQLTACLGF
ncbi:SPARC-related modular calcium-binding protein 2-like [Danio aesculapii]|uniref:SPARC-related modular calcium-binding protein 2-like n=1 Tax=Danio aesculapii TaxID=1142201 RepID=UPI0024C017FF|nr:SPARC-related modular calcium-binding protein 2-like [Danio aesculapii]